ncbi:MAG: DUF2723 domain-containing protein [bacterium]
MKKRKELPVSFKTIDYLFGILVFFISFGVYLHTLSPTVTSGDVGDHIVCAWLLSIPHPTGYPFYMILSHLFCLVPIGNLAYRMNFLSALFASLSVMLLFFSGRKLNLNTFLSCFSSFLFGFSWVFWSQVLVAEVYTLNIFFISLILFLLLNFKERKSPLLLGFLFGIGLSHHLSISFIIPGTILFIIMSNKRKLFEIKTIGLALLFLIIGLLLWLYLLIASLDNPYLAWGSIKGIKDLFYFASGREFTQHHLLNFYSKDEIKWFFYLLLDQFLFLFLIGLFGLFCIAKKRFRLFAFFFITIVINLIFAFHYHIYDIEVYYLSTFFILSLLIGYGVNEIFKMLKKRVFATIGSFFLAIILLALFLRDLPSVNMRDYYHIYDYGKAILKTVPDKKVLFDTSHVGYFSLWYLLVCEEPEREVCVIPEGWLSKPWTIEGFKKRHQWFREALKDEPKNEYGIYTNVQSVYENILRNNQETSIYYVYGPILKNPSSPITEEGIVFKHQGNSNKVFEYIYRNTKRKYKDYWARVGASVFHNNMGSYYYRLGKYKEALLQFEISAFTDPKNISLLTNLGIIYYLTKDYNKASSVFERILKFDPNNTNSKQMLEECKKKMVDKN